MRLDLYLVNEGYFESRNKAIEALKNKRVKVDGLFLKPSFNVLNTPKIEILSEMPYVSRGGLKLEKAIDEFKLDFDDKIVLDVGASTGGFTDCALKHGASLVYAIDVGSNQLHESLRNNQKVISYENMNILDFNTNQKFDFIVMDVSFVSAKKIVLDLIRFLNEDNKLVLLIKPQFEVGKMINNGVIKDRRIVLNVLKDVVPFLEEKGVYLKNISISPIKGGSGNIEFISLFDINKSDNFQSLFEKMKKDLEKY